MDAKRKHKLKDRRTRRNRVRTMNSQTGPSGAGGSGDRGRGQTTARARDFTAITKEVTELYYGNWSARKGIDIPVDDMLREPWAYEGLDDPQKKLVNTAQDDLDVIGVLGQALRLERLLGGSVILMGVASDGDVDPREPLDPTTVQKGDLKFLNVIPRSRITKTDFSSDPMAANYGRPELYTVAGHTIHRSRLLIFDGNPIAPNNAADLSTTNLRRRNDGFGDSVMESVLDDLTYATGSRQAAFHLINQASVWLIETDFLTLKETKQGQAALEALENMSQQISTYKAALMDNGGDSSGGSSLSSVSPSFGSVPELMMSFLQVLSGAFDIPATRYMSQAPGGLNSSGTGDLENYYNQVESNQRRRLRPQLMKLLAVLIPSTLGPEVVSMADVDVIFEPLWNLSEVELSTVRVNDANALVALTTASIITSHEAAAEAKERGILVAESTLAAMAIDTGAAPNLDDELARLAR